MSASVFEQLVHKLDAQQAAYSVLHHEPVFTSEQAAAVRGVPLSTGAKALVLKAGDSFIMVVLPADRKFDGKKAKQNLKVKGTRFADKDEVLSITRLTPGSIPPFGSLFGLPTFCDQTLMLNETINFNAGDHAISISLPLSDYLRIEAPTLCDVT